MDTDWSINILIITGLLVIANNILHFSFNPDKIGGGKLFILVLIIILTLGMIFGNYILQTNNLALGDDINLEIQSRNEQILKTNDSLNTIIHNIGQQNEHIKNALKSFTRLAQNEFPDLGTDDALMKLADNLVEMEKTAKKYRPRLVFLGDSTKLTESGGETFYFTTYYFRAKGSSVRNLKVSLQFTGFIATITDHIQGIAPINKEGRIKIHDNSKGFTYSLDLLPHEFELLITVKSREWLKVVSKKWSPG